MATMSLQLQWCNSGTNILEVSNSTLIEFKACSTGENHRWWYWKPHKSPQVSEVIDFSGEPTTATFLSPNCILNIYPYTLRKVQFSTIIKTTSLHNRRNPYRKQVVKTQVFLQCASTTDASTTEFLHLSLMKHLGRRGRKIVRGKGPGKLL